MLDNSIDTAKKDFVKYLDNLGLTPASHKNYRSDLNHFTGWLILRVRSFGSYIETLTEAVPFLNKNLAAEYKSFLAQNNIPAKTINRRLSTLRHLAKFMNRANLMEQNFMEGIENMGGVITPKNIPGPVVTGFQSYLEEEKVSKSTVKNYISDVRHFISRVPGLSGLTEDLIKDYQAKVSTDFSPATAKRKVISVGKFLNWAKTKGMVDTTLPGKQISAKFAGKAYGNNRFKNIYKRYRSIPNVLYLNIIVGLLLASALGLGIYNQFIKNAMSPLAATSLVAPSRYLSFQGRLTNQYLNPITAATNTVFTLYDAASAGTTLWTSGTCSISPDTDGVFSTLLGSTCGSAIPKTVFSDNAAVWLGVTVGTDAEATPRIQIATVAYALNSETLQGYPASASATINTVPVINNSGQMVLAASSPKIQSTSGTFAIEGQAVTIDTPSASNGSITISPDGTGSAQFIFNGASPGTGTGMLSATDANLTSGSLIYGSVASNATGYNLLQLQSGSTPVNKFVIDSAGNATVSATLSLGPMVQGLAGTCNAAAAGKQYYDGIAQAYYYCNGTTWTQIGSGSGVNYWQLNSPVLSPANTSYDLVIGGTSTASAKFQVFASTGDITTAGFASASGNLTLAGAVARSIQTTGFGNLTIGGDTTGNILLSPSNNIAGGNVSPNTTGVTDLGTSSLLFRNIYATSLYQGVNLVCDAGGNNCPSGAGLWNQSSGVLYPTNNTVDVLFGANSGATATTSAKFAFTGIAGAGLPTASVSGNIAGVATYLTGNGNLATTNDRDLTLGGSYTGNVVINSKGVTALTANGLNLTTGGTITLPNAQTLTGVTNFIESSAGFSVNGSTTYYFDSSGNINANAGTFAQNLAVNGGNITTTALAFTLAASATSINIQGSTTSTATLNIGNSSNGTAINLTSGTGPQTFTSSNATGQATAGSFVFKDTALSTGDLIFATASSIFTGNFLRFDNATATKYTLDSAGNASQSGSLTLGNGSTIRPAYGPLTFSYKSAANTWTTGLTLADTTGNVTIAQNLGVGGVGQFGGTSPTSYSRFGTTATTHALSAAQDVLIGGAAELNGVLYLNGRNIASSNGTSTITFPSDPTASNSYNALSNGSWLVQNNANNGIAALMVDQTKGGDVLSASSSGAPVFTIQKSGNIVSSTGNLASQVANSATAVGITLNTTNTLSTQGSKLLSVQNNGTEKFYVDAQGNLYTSGSIISGNGMGILMTNKSGGIVAKRSLVVLDGTNNSSFTTTTTPYSKAVFGVITGVGLGNTNDANGDGNCDANDVCMVATGGEVDVTVKNATTASRNDYLFTSDTAGSAVASAKQFDGLIGVVSNTTNAASGYLKMIFKVQPQVTASAAIDKGSKHNEYWLYANSYSAVNQGSDTSANLLARGLMFDNFYDTTKTDSANTTVSGPVQFGQGRTLSAQQGSTFSIPASPYRAGLIGGQTLATSTTDNAGNTYLGSNTVNKVFYYDRTRDSAAQVQVELGIDSNWYNGSTLSVATSSATFSQNDTITKPNPNLSPTYNGSLLKVTGNYANNAKTIYITIKSPTTFDWTDYNGNAVTGVTMTPGTAQALGGTGVSVTFTNVSYNTGDVFKIASWFTEPTGSTRGTKQQFPERSNIVATASSVDIIDADTQKLWMRFSQGTSYALGVDANNDPSSVNMLNGELYVSENGSSATGLYRLDFTHDAAFKQNATDWRLSDTALASRNGVNNYNVINTSNILVNITANDVSAAVIPNQPTQTVTVSGWGYLQGNGTTTISEAVNFPYKFNNTPTVLIANAGSLYNVGAPTKLSDCSQNSWRDAVANTNAITTTNFNGGFYTAGTFASTYYLCYTWTATGQVSPRQYVAVATGASADGGTTIINETDQSAVNVLVGSQHADTLWTSKVALTNNGTLYSALNDSSSPWTSLSVYYSAAGLTASDASWGVNQSGSYYVNGVAGGWTSGGPSILGATAANQINTLSVTQGTSTVDGKSNTIYLGTGSGLTVLQEKQSGSYSPGDGADEKSGSVKYYTKDYITEEMVGDIRGMWPMNIDGASVATYSGTIAKGAFTGDVSISNNDLQVGGAAVTLASGVRDQGLTFNGSTNYLSCTDAACGGTSKLDYSGSGGWSVGAWVKTSATSNAGIVGKMGTGSGQYGYRIRETSTGVAEFGMSSNGSNFNIATGTTTINDGIWHHVVGTFTPSTSLTIYVDGVLQNTNTTSIPSVIFDTAGGFTIGASYITPSELFNGTIDEPFVTATALTAGQIKHMYEVGYRALQSHATTLGGGAADLNQQLGFISTGTNVVGDAKPDYNNQFMYVGLNSTTLGGLSKIQLNSDTNIKTYNSTANVPAGGPLLIDEDVNTIGVGYNLETVGSAASGVKTMGVDNNATATSGNFVSKTVTTAESFTQAYIWSQYVLDASDASNTITAWASNDGGSNYYQCNLTNTDTSQSPTEYEYFCQFNTPGSSLKTKFVMARGSTKTNTYITRYGIAWIGSDAIAGAPGGNGLYTNTNASVANGSYIDVAHNQNSNDIISNAWVQANGQWKDVATATESGIISTSASVANGSYLEVTHNQNTNDLLTSAWVASGSAYQKIGDLSTAPAEATPSANTVGLWHMNEASGNVLDSSGNGNTGTPTGTTVTTGPDARFNNARSFNGSTDYVSMGDTASLDITGNQITLVCWVKISAHQAYGGICGKQDDTAANSAYGLNFYNTNNTITWLVYTGSGGSPTSTKTIVDNQWHQLVGTYDGAQQKLYIDGVLDATGAQTGNINNSADPFMIGRFNTAGRFVTGSIDEVQVLNTALTPGQIRQQYLDGVAKYNITQPDNNHVRLYNYSGYQQNLKLDVSTQAFQIQQLDANTVRLYNYSGSTQNLRLDVITGGLGRNSGTVSLAPSAADVNANANTNSLWINNTAAGGNLLKLQTNGTDVLSLTSTGLMTLAGNFLPGADNTYDLGATASARFRELFLGPASLHLQAKTTDSGYSGIGQNVDYALGIASASGSFQLGLNGNPGNANALLTVTQNGNLGVSGTASVSGTLTIGNGNAIQSAFGPLNLAYKSGANTWATGLTIQDTTGNVGIGTTSPSGKLGIGSQTAMLSTAGITLGGSDNLVEFVESNYQSGYGHKIYGYDTGSDTQLRIAGRANSASWTTEVAIQSTGYVTFYAGHNDLAENYLTSGKVLRGSLTSIGTTDPWTVIASDNNHPSLVGVVSTTPGAVMDADGGYQIGASTKPQYENEKAPIALQGTAPTLVTSQNGVINIGDAIGISNTPGYGAKMITAGQIVGKTLEKLDTGSCPTASSVDSIVWPEDDGKNTLKPCFSLPDGTYVGKIMVAVAPSWYDPDVYLTSTGDLNISQNNSGNYQLTNTSNNSVIDRIGAFGQMVAGNIKAGAIETNDFISNNIIAKVIHTDIISPIPGGTDVTVQIGSTATPSGQFVIQNASGSAVVAIDNSGNASFSGQVTGDRLQVANNATVSGTLFADNIQSLTIDQITAQLNQVKVDQGLLAQAATWNTNTATDSAHLSAITSTLSANDLYVTNQAAINSLSVSTTLSVGTDLVIQAPGFDTLSAPLRIQSLAMAPVEIMGGLVSIDTQGNMQIAGNLAVAGRITSAGLTLQGTDATASASLLSLQDQTGLQVAGVNASGSASFSNLTTGGLTIASDTSASSSAAINGVITTNATAGSATIPAGVSEITIKNPKVSDYTLVYVTPTSSTQNNVLYVKSKQAGQFVVGFSTAINVDTSFNWWVVQVQ